MNSDLLKIISGIVTMALIIIGITFIVNSFNSCDNNIWNRETFEYNLSSDGYIIKEIDSCEYFMVRIGAYSDGGNFLPVHKHNCKFCKERENK